MDTKLSDVQQKEKIKDTKLNQIWNILTKYCEWDSLMGSSIQPDAKENTKPEVILFRQFFIINVYLLLLLLFILLVSLLRSQR